MSRVMPTSSSTGTAMTAMASPKRPSACTPWRQLPVLAQMDRGMMATSAAMTVAVFRKVSTWR